MEAPAYAKLKFDSKTIFPRDGNNGHLDQLVVIIDDYLTVLSSVCTLILVAGFFFAVILSVGYIFDGPFALCFWIIPELLPSFEDYSYKIHTKK